MKFKYFLLILFWIIGEKVNAQIIYTQGGLLNYLLYKTAMNNMPEHGFLPGKKFPTYDLLNKYNFNGKKIKVFLYDNRDSLHLKNLSCSDVELTNQTEFNKEQGIHKVWLYINKLFKDANLIIDSNASEAVEIHLMGLDSRLIGFGKITAHGLCQIEVKQSNLSKLYCTDLEDGAKTSPLGKKSLASRKTAIRFMMSAAIRDTIEKILSDL